MRTTPTALATCAVIALGCAGPRELASIAPAAGIPPPPPDSDVSPAPHDPLEAVLAAARETLGMSHPRVDGEAIPTDCSGYLHALYKQGRVDLFAEGRPTDNGVRAIARWVERHGRFYRAKVGARGDVVFFDNSYDRDGDGRLNDRLTHAGLVEEVLADGTMMIVHASNHGIVREPMNLLHPHDLGGADGRAINAALRRRGKGDGPRTPHLMSELFAGFGTVVASPSALAAKQ